MIAIKELNNQTTIPMIGLGVFKVRAGGETAAVVHAALKAGYRHIDTAAAYGNEADVGLAIRESGIPREEIFITTKLWNEDMRQNRTREALGESLAALGTSYVDLYLTHWPVAEKYIESYLVMQTLYAEGKARAIGVSNCQAHHLDALLQKADIVPAVNQVEHHPLLTQKPLMAYCERHGIALEAYSPFGSGGAPVLKEEVILALAKKHGRSPAQIVLRWNLQQGVIALPRSVHAERIRQNIELDFTLSAEDIAAIDALDKGRRFMADPDHFDF